MKKSTGFTLIELMVVVAIVGILATIAYPAYQANLFKTQRSTANSLLSEIMQNQEVRYAENLTYSINLGTIGVNPLGYNLTGLGVENDNRTYLVTAAACPAPQADLRQCVLLTANAVNGQVGDVTCLTMSLQSDGTRMGNVECWR